MSWYNNVFTDKVPEKGDPIKFEDLPRIPKDDDQDDEESVAKKTSDFDFVFSQKFVFSQMPTKEGDVINFLNNSNTREQNPANLQKTGFSTLTGVKTTVSNAVSSVGRALGNGASFVSKWTGLTSLYNAYYGTSVVRGGGASRTQKRNKRNSKKTHRKILL
jgi:hypothetical protein